MQRKLAPFYIGLSDLSCLTETVIVPEQVEKPLPRVSTVPSSHSPPKTLKTRRSTTFIHKEKVLDSNQEESNMKDVYENALECPICFLVNSFFNYLNCIVLSKKYKPIKML